MYAVTVAHVHQVVVLVHDGISTIRSVTAVINSATRAYVVLFVERHTDISQLAQQICFFVRNANGNLKNFLMQVYFVVIYLSKNDSIIY